MRVQVPCVIRWKHKLRAGIVLHVEVSTRPLSSERFYARLRKDGRITIPKVYSETLGLEPSMIVTVKVEIPEDSLEEEIHRTALEAMTIETAPWLFSSRD